MDKLPHRLHSNEGNEQNPQTLPHEIEDHRKKNWNKVA